MFETLYLRSNHLHNKVLSGISWAYESSEHCKTYKTRVGWLRFSAGIDSFMTHFKFQLKHFYILFSHLYVNKLLKTHEVNYFNLNVGNITKNKQSTNVKVSTLWFITTKLFVNLRWRSSSLSVLYDKEKQYSLITKSTK